MTKIAKKLLNYAVKKAELIPVTADWKDVEEKYVLRKNQRRIRELREDPKNLT